MTSQLNVDTIVDKAGSGGTNVKVANTSTYVSDGGAVTQNTVQGIAKTWMFASSAAVINDSFNIASSEDAATGQYNYTYTNVFSNNKTSIHTTPNTGSDRTATESGRATTGTTIETFNTSGSNIDSSHSLCVHGDLA